MVDRGLPPMHEDRETLITHWRAESIRERQASYPSYEAELEFPFFTSTVTDLVELNTLERSAALRRLTELRSIRLSLPPVDHGSLSTLPSILTSSFEVSLYTDEIVSIRHSIFHYGSGAAHPNHVTAVTNVQLGPLIPLQFADLFSRRTQYLRTLSDYCVSRLTEEKGLAQPSDGIREGAGPDIKNFSKFNITPGGLLITFDEYQVDCYAAGGSQVLIDRSFLTDYLNPSCSVSRVWDAREPGAGSTSL